MPFIFKNTLLKENNNTFFKDFLKTQIDRLAVKKNTLQFRYFSHLGLKQMKL